MYQVSLFQKFTVYYFDFVKLTRQRIILNIRKPNIEFSGLIYEIKGQNNIQDTQNRRQLTLYHQPVNNRRILMNIFVGMLSLSPYKTILNLIFK